MRRKLLTALGAAGCALLLAVPMTAASKSAPEATKAPVKHAVVKHNTRQREWHPVTLSGKIMMFDSAKKLVVMQGSQGVPFDVIVTHATRIKSGDHTLKLSDLASQTNKAASINLVPERRGDVARSISITG